MTPRVKRRYSYLSIGLIGLGLMLLQYGNILPMIYGCYPMLMLPLVLYSGIHFGAVSGAIIGALVGTVTDIFFGLSPVFHAVAFCVFGCVAGFLITYYFNHNRKTVSLLTAAVCVLYFLLKWVLFYFERGSLIGYFIKIGLPSALYTAVLCVPLYLLISVIINATEKLERR